MNCKMNWKSAMVALLFCAAMAVAAQGQTFTKLHDFNGTDGGFPGYGSLVQGVDGNLYGTTSIGGSGSAGTVFRITPSGTFATIYSFCTQTNCADGSTPAGGLTLGPDGSLYGTTSAGGVGKRGTIYKIATDGTFSTFYSFCTVTNCHDGGTPISPPVLAFDGSFYGTTFDGTVYRITLGGTLTTLYNFCPGNNCPVGTPQGGLVQASDRNFYGTTTGGCCTAGTVFRITPSGTLTTLENIGTTIPGSQPEATMTMGRDGNVYGLTVQQASVFKTTVASGATTLVNNLCSGSSCNYGNLTSGRLELGTDGNFYGMAQIGVTTNTGTIFRVTPTGTAKLLHQFHGKPDGDDPDGGLFQATNGNFYGASTYGGVNKTCNSPLYCGTVFRFSMKFGPFVRTAQSGAKIGNTIIILGNGLTGSTAVTFNGTTATFTVVSDTEITATVPAGATTGTIQVVTAGTTLKSNAVFRVLP